MLLMILVPFVAFLVAVVLFGFQVGPQAGKRWALGVPDKDKGVIYEYDPTGVNTYKER